MFRQILQMLQRLSLLHPEQFSVDDRQSCVKWAAWERGAAAGFSRRCVAARDGCDNAKRKHLLDRGRWGSEIAASEAWNLKM